MKNPFTYQKQTSIAALTLVVSCLTTSVAMAQSDNPGIVPVDQKAYGKTYGQWAAAWQQWAFGLPADQSPFLDETGASAAAGQAGPVWFLAGNFGGQVVRNITVPENNSIFFPVVNSFFIRTEPTEPTTVEGIRAILQGFLVDASFSCAIDGQTVNDVAGYYTESPLFTERLYADNIFGLAPGKYAPAMNLGYYLMVEPFSVGTHTIHFTGFLPGGPGEEDDFSLDVTYNITVVSDDQDQN